MDDDQLDDSVRRSRRLVSRRRALSLGGTIGLGSLLAACATGDETDDVAAERGGRTEQPRPSLTAGQVADESLVAEFDAARTCAPFPEQTEGPFWFDVDSIRSDIREDRPGTVLDVAFRVQDVSACSSGGRPRPVTDAVVEIWHCDAGGRYSGFESGAPGRGGGTSDGAYSAGDPEAVPADDGTYLRGAQVADRNGIVQFTTIYPGWYEGRTTHIHVKVHVSRQTVLSTQVYMPDDASQEVYAAAPYRDHYGRGTFNADDGIYSEDAVLTVSRRDGKYRALINLGLTL